MKKRIIALLLSIVLVLGLLAGCAKTSESKTEEPAKTEENAAPEVSTEAGAEPTSLRLIMYGDSTTRRDEFFENEFHDAVLEALNIDFVIEWLPWSEMVGPTITNMLAAGENIAFENILSISDFHTKGYVAAISEDDIKEYMPNYLKMRGENNGFECFKYQGEIYGIPIGNKPYAGRHQSITVRNDILNEVGLDAADIKTYDDLVNAIVKVKEKYPEMTVMRGVDALVHSLGFDLAGVDTGEFVDPYIFVNEMEDGDTVYSYYESDLYKNYVKMVEDWVARGFVTSDVITNPGQDEADWNAGNALMMYGVPGNLIETNLKAVFPNADLKNIKIGDFPYVKTRDYDWGISIAANDSSKIKDWLRLIDWMYKDQETYNFCIYGVEGQDWKMAEDGTIEKLVSDSFWDDWFMEASCYVSFNSSISQENIDAYMANDDGSVISKLSGFTFDPTAVETEVALMDAVKTEYFDAMTYGFFNYDDNYEEAIALLKEAGLDKYVAEYQRQFSEWYAANK